MRMAFFASSAASLTRGSPVASSRPTCTGAAAPGSCPFAGDPGRPGAAFWPPNRDAKPPDGDERPPALDCELKPPPVIPVDADCSNDELRDWTVDSRACGVTLRVAPLAAPVSVANIA